MEGGSERQHLRGCETPMEHESDKDIQSSWGITSGVLCEIVYWIDRFKLTKICRPSATPLTVDAKLSSMEM